MSASGYSVRTLILVVVRDCNLMVNVKQTKGATRFFSVVRIVFQDVPKPAVCAGFIFCLPPVKQRLQRLISKD